MRLRRISWPIPPGARPAPITATLFGSSRPRMAATDASRSRSPLAALTPRTSVMSRLTPTTPASGVPTRSMKPAWQGVDVEASPAAPRLWRSHPLDEARVPEHLEHGQVLGHRLGAEARDPHRTAHLSQVFEEQRGDASTLELVTDHEGDLGLARCGDAEVAHSDHRSGVECAEVGVGGGV